MMRTNRGQNRGKFNPQIHQGENNRSGNRITPVSVNWHITKRCNFNCKFCFANMNDVSFELEYEKAIEIPYLLKTNGCKKINFVGGEPLLYPHIFDMIRESKRCGLTTSLVTNGSLLNEDKIKKLSPYLDWVGISIDSANEKTQRELGRGFGDHVEKTLELVDLLEKYDLKIKINTVVNRLNWKEEMTDFIREVDPQRWKIFQVLKIEGENDHSFDDLMITKEQFSTFKEKNEMVLTNGTSPVFENNSEMIGSYIMIDPQGRLFDNMNGNISYQSVDILNMKESLANIRFDSDLFIQRGGIYEW